MGKLRRRNMQRRGRRRDASGCAIVIAFGLLGFVVLLGTGVALATDFNWQAPTEYEDETALTVADLASYSLICQGVTFTYPGDQTMSMEDFAPGNYSCTLTVTATNGLTSAPSNVVSFTVAPPPSPPSPPILFVTS